MDYKTAKRIIFSRTPPSFKFKPEFYALFKAGFLGNKPITWSSYKKIIESGWKDKVCMKLKEIVGIRKTLYDIPLEEVPEIIKDWVKEGIPEEKIYFNQSLPNHNLLLQGELMRGSKGLCLTYTTVKKPMNLGLKQETKTATGLKVLRLLKENLYPNSFDDIMELLDMFPNDIIEFSCYTQAVGNLSNRNTIIWEVRNF